MRILLIDGTSDLPTGNNEIVPFLEQRLEFMQVLGRQGTFRKESDDRIAGCHMIGMDIGRIQSWFGLTVNRNAGFFQIGHGSIGAAAIHGEDFVKATKRQSGDIDLASLQFIPDE